MIAPGRALLFTGLGAPAPPRSRMVGSGLGEADRCLSRGLARRWTHLDLVDLCPALLEQARKRTAGLPNVRVIEADAVTYQPDRPVDCVYFSYSLTMIPNWEAALGNALAMLKPGGRLGVVDFYVSQPVPAPGLIRHGWASRQFWSRWFGHDGVHPNPAHLPALRRLLPNHVLTEHSAPLPYLPGLRVPYYCFVGHHD